MRSVRMEKWKKEMLSMKDLVFIEKPVKKLTKRYIVPYKIKEVVLRDVVKLKLPASMRIYPVVNISRIERYRKLVRGQRVDQPKPVKIDRVEK